MTNEIFRVFGSVLLKDKEAMQGLDNVDKKASGVGKTFGKLAKGVAVAGTLIGTALLAVGVKSTQMATDFEKGMANISTLLDGEFKPRIEELSKEVTGLMMQTGQSAEILQDGLYNVISAFGDSADSMKILETASKGAAAGNSTVTEAVNLLSAVTKGYGDTSAEANQKASDLAFTTVKLGQTTFPELAGAMGKVIPMASALNISQEELFGSFATLTGVTGSASEVTTQLRGILQGMLNPSEKMASAISSLGHESGTAMLETLGLNGTLQELLKSTNGNEVEMSKLWSTVEAAPALLALVGGQADVFVEKTNAMTKAAGMTEEAFARAKETLNVLMVEVGTKLLPVVNNLLQSIMPMVPRLMELVDGFMQKILPVFEKLTDALLPALFSIIEALIPIFNPILDILLELVDKVLIQLIYLLVPIIEKIMPIFIKLFEQLGPPIMEVLRILMSVIRLALPPLVDLLLKLVETVLPVFAKILNTLTPIIEFIAEVALGYFTHALEMLMPVIDEMAIYLEELMPTIELLAELFMLVLVPVLNTMLPIMIKLISLLSKGLVVYFKIMTQVVQSVTKAFKGLMTTTPQEVFDKLVQSMKNTWEWFKNIGKNILDFYKNTWGNIIGWFSGIWTNIKSFFENAWNGIIDFLKGVPKKIGDAIEQLLRTIRIKFLLWKLNTKRDFNEFVENIVQFFKDLPMNMWNAFNASVDWLIDKIAGFIHNVLLFFWELPENVKNAINQLWENIKISFTAGIEWLKAIPGKILEFINNFIRGIREGFETGAIEMQTRIGSIGAWIGNFIHESFERLKTFIANIVNFFKEVPSKVLNAISSLAERMKNFAITTFNNFKNASIERLNNLIAWFKEMPGKVISAITSLINRMKTFGATIFDKFKEGSINRWNNFVTWLKGLPNTIINTFKNLGKSMQSIGKDIIDGLWVGIQNMTTWLKDKLTAFAKKAIPDPIAKALGIASPSKLFKRFGKNISEGLAVGIDDAKKLVEDASYRLSIAAQAGAKLTPEFTNVPTTNNYYSANRRIEVPVNINGRTLVREVIEDIDEGLDDLTRRRRD
jgi:TP901 family phage tail tape measure protein